MAWWEPIAWLVGGLFTLLALFGLCACILSSQISRQEERLPRLPVPESEPIEPIEPMERRE